MIKYGSLLNVSFKSLQSRSFSYSSVLAMRRPPKEEYDNNGFKTRKRTADPFDRRWSWTAKRAEPYNIRGGHIDWTKNPMMHRGVQKPGYIDPVTKEFVFVREMIPEIVVPEFRNCELKPYVSYNVKDINTETFDARALFKQTLQKEIVQRHKQDEQAKSSLE